MTMTKPKPSVEQAQLAAINAADSFGVGSKQHRAALLTLSRAQTRERNAANGIK